MQCCAVSATERRAESQSSKLKRQKGGVSDTSSDPQGIHLSFFPTLWFFLGSSPSQSNGLLWVPIQAAVLYSRRSEARHTGLHAVPQPQCGEVCVMRAVCFQRRQGVRCEEDHAEQPQVLRTMFIPVCGDTHCGRPVFLL